MKAHLEAAEDVAGALEAVVVVAVEPTAISVSSAAAVEAHLTEVGLVAVPDTAAVEVVDSVVLHQPPTAAALLPTTVEVAQAVDMATAPTETPPEAAVASPGGKRTVSTLTSLRSHFTA